MKRAWLLAVLLALAALPAAAQPIDVTFRFLPDLTWPPIEPVVRAFVPGEFNNWGPNSNGQIQEGAPSQMTYHEALAEYRYTVALTPGQTVQYKIHYHQTSSPASGVWISDPLNPRTNPNDNNNSVLTVTDPLAFQLAREQNEDGQVVAVSAGLFGTEAFTSIQFQVNAGPLTDGLAHYDAESGIFRYELPQPIAAPGYFRIVATDALGRTIDEEVGLLPPQVVDLPRPAGLEDGITYVDASTVRLSLFAPHKSFVHVIGDVTDWEVDPDFLMYRDAGGADPATADSVWWWIELDGLAPGEDVRFQYLVDGSLRIADPYSALVLLPEDGGIPGSAFPDRPPYPQEAAGAPVTLLQPGRAPYEWQVEDFQPPAQEDLVIYELLLRDFLAAHDYDTLADTLDYLARLGVNAIELMPVAEFGGNVNWGYQPTFHLALDKYYGPPDQFKAFVDAAHARGIAVLLDVVYNHADQPSPLVTLYGCTEASPYANSPARHPFSVFCDLDHTYSGTQYWLDRANRWWIDEYRVDGYRFDLTGGFMQSGNFFGYNAQRVAILKRMMAALWEAHPQAIIILEHLIESQQEWRELGTFGRDEGWPGPLLWNNMNHAYSESTMGYLNAGSNLRASYPPNWVGQLPVDAAVTYMESHDEQWMMYKNIAYGACANYPSGGNGCNTDPGAYNIRDLHVALERQKLAGTFFFTIPGPRMLWQFGELGYGWGDAGEQCLVNGDYPGECPNGVPGRTAPKPIRWDYQDDWRRTFLYETWAALINLRNDFAIFTSPETAVEMNVGQGVAGRRIALTLEDAPEGEPSRVVVVGNFGLEPLEVTPSFPQTGTWYEFFSDTELAVTDPQAPILLLPGEARVYTDVDVPSPEAGIYAVADEEAPGTPLVFRLDAAYPNPFTSVTTLTYALPEAATVRLEVFDVLGRRVRVLVDETLPAGEHRVALSAAGLPSGTYLVRLAAGDRAATSRVTLIR